MTDIEAVENITKILLPHADFRMGKAMQSAVQAVKACGGAVETDDIKQLYDKLHSEAQEIRASY